MSVLTPGVASAAEVVVPNTGFGVNVDGLEALPGLSGLPGVEQYIPSLTGQSVPAAAAPLVAALPAAAPAAGNQAVVDAVRSRLGSPYVYGAAGPSTFDCSGLTSWAYAQAGKSIPRTSQAQAASGQNIPLSDMQPGDIIAYYGGASHVAIYTGNGMMIDALNTGSPVAERPVNYMPIHSVIRY